MRFRDHHRRHDAAALAASVNMHPVSFAIIGIVALAFGLVTPPYGLCLMISCASPRCDALRAQGHDDHAGADAAGCWPLIVWPEIPLFLPRAHLAEFLK
jgi:TRAP-type C4-dicarboxylate transport system permease large subunit